MASWKSLSPAATALAHRLRILSSMRREGTRQDSYRAGFVLYTVYKVSLRTRVVARKCHPRPHEVPHCNERSVPNQLDSASATKPHRQPTESSAASNTARVARRPCWLPFRLGTG